MTISNALAALRNGKSIVLYDGDEREGEADLVFHAKFVKPGRIEYLRKQAGGLICMALGNSIASQLWLPFLADALAHSTLSGMVVKKTAYGDPPAFSIPINHRDVYTGITDNDRALTIRNLAEIVEKNNGIACDFTENFYTPGHVFLLIGRGLENRRGHTELSLELAKRAGLSEAMVLCEMLGKGKALSKEKAKAFAQKEGLVFLEGREIQ